MPSPRHYVRKDLIPGRLPVLPAFRGPVVGLGCSIPENCLIPSVDPPRITHLVAPIHQAADCLIRNAGFHTHSSTSSVLTRWGRPTGMIPSGGIPGFLEVHAKIDEVHDDLGMALGLKIAPHDTKAHPGRTVLGDKGRNYVVEGSFARRVGVGLAFF